MQRNPVFSTLLTRKRVLIPATGHYEWGQNTRKPYNIRLKSRRPFAFAGLWDTCEIDGEVCHTSSIITGAAGTGMAGLHDRIPIILPADSWDTWLDRRVMDPNRLMDLLEPYPENFLEWYEVSRKVGNVQYDDPECVAAVNRP